MSATEFLERFHTVFLSMSISHHNHNLSLCLFSTFHAHLTSELFISFCRTQLQIRKSCSCAVAVRGIASPCLKGKEDRDAAALRRNAPLAYQRTPKVLEPPLFRLYPPPCPLPMPLPCRPPRPLLGVVKNPAKSELSNGRNRSAQNKNNNWERKED